MSLKVLATRLGRAGVTLAMVTDHDSFGGAGALAAGWRASTSPSGPLAAEMIRTDLGDVIVVLKNGQPPAVEQPQLSAQLDHDCRPLNATGQP